jgi:hypothetical protein
MRRFACAAMVVATALGFCAAGAEAWSGSEAGSGSPLAGPAPARYGSPFAGPAPAGPWPGGGTYGNGGPPEWLQRGDGWVRNPARLYHGNQSPIGPSVGYPHWAWVEPTWRWTGSRWVWVPGYWVPAR